MSLNIREGLTFDDVLLVPQKSDVILQILFINYVEVFVRVWDTVVATPFKN